MNTAPDSYLHTQVPDDIKKAWRRWEGADWRKMQSRGSNRPHPPDERFSVRRPPDMCPVHRQAWLDYRNMHFDPHTGDRWPGTPGSPFLFIGHDMGDILEQRRVEWDEKASDQMRLIERICLSGTSPQCEGKRVP